MHTTYLYVCTHAYIHIYLLMHVCLHIFMHIDIKIHMHTIMHVCLYIYVCVCVCVSAYIHMHLHAYNIHPCIHSYIYTNTQIHACLYYTYIDICMCENICIASYMSYYIHTYILQINMISEFPYSVFLEFLNSEIQKFQKYRNHVCLYTCMFVDRQV